MGFFRQKSAFFIGGLQALVDWRYVVTVDNRRNSYLPRHKKKTWSRRCFFRLVSEQYL